MSTFNLIDEPWISVVTDYKGTTKLVGLKEFFQNAHTYIALAGDMPTQDFAVMRFLLAVLHTVFSRYDAHGEVYEMIEVNDRMQQVKKVYEEDEEEYEDALMETWRDLWTAEKCPDIVVQYLETWHDRFYLFDEKYPFYQVTEDIMQKVDKTFIDNSSKTAIISYKLMNRTISESMNKDALFSPRTHKNKNDLTDAELTRWLITFQGVSNSSDKKSINTLTGKSIGWIYNLGGVFLSTDCMYRTLILNLLLKHPESQYNTLQKPCWELSQIDLYNKYVENETIDNLADLYTNWGRLMYCFVYKGKEIKELIDTKVFRVAKTNAINEENNFLEPMTIWGSKDNKYFIKKHQEGIYAWRSFGSLINTRGIDDIRLPGIIDNLLYARRIKNKNEWIQINTISAIYNKDDRPSRTLIGESYDNLNLELFVATDLLNHGWIVRINDVVEQTQRVVDKTYRGFLCDVEKIRNIKSGGFTSKHIETMYFELDKPFRDWIAGIDYQDDKDEKIENWNATLKKLVIAQAKKIVEEAGPRDFTGIIEKDSVRNIATAFDSFMLRIHKIL